MSYPCTKHTSYVIQHTTYNMQHTTLNRRDRPHAYEERREDGTGRRDTDISVCTDGSEQCNFLIVFLFCFGSVVVGIFIGLYFGFYNVTGGNDSSTEVGMNTIPVSGHGGNGGHHGDTSRLNNNNINETNNDNNQNTDADINTNPSSSSNENSNTQNNDENDQTNALGGKEEEETTTVSDKDGIFRPKCENGIFSAVSWESVTSMITNDNSMCYNERISKDNGNMRLLSPSDPDRIVSAYFDCVINDPNTNVCPKLALKSYNPKNDINAQILRGSVALRSKSQDFVNSAPQMECLNSIYDNIDIKYGPYNDNERYQECINIRLSNLIGILLSLT